MSLNIPPKGYVFWNVGNGDSTSIVIDDSHWMQIDLNHKVEADEEDSAYTPVIDKLIEHLPKKNKKPYLAAFALTHPDRDHCLGFQRLFEEVVIGELIFSPRIFDEYKKDLCDDAIAFKEEAERRVKATIKNPDAGSGERVRIIGYSDILKEEPYKGFPESRLTVPGKAFEELDGDELAGQFRAFVHAPFKDDLAGDDRNGTSLAFQIRLIVDGKNSNVLFFGDHAYPVLHRIFDISEEDDLEWGVFLSPHHCSKSAMYWADSADEDETFRQDIMDNLEEHKIDPGYCVSSCEPVPSSNKKGDNPPHAKAKNRYQEIVETDHFLVTQEHPNTNKPEPITFEATHTGLVYMKTAKAATPTENKAKAAAVAFVSRQEPPTKSQRYG